MKKFLDKILLKFLIIYKMFRLEFFIYAGTFWYIGLTKWINPNYNFKDLLVHYLIYLALMKLSIWFYNKATS